MTFSRMSKRTHVVAALLASIAIVTTSQAQARTAGLYSGTTPIARYEYESFVYLSHIEVLLPPSYIRVRRPEPAIRGFYAWKFSFGENPFLTLVLRSDSALAVQDDKAVIRASKVYLCENAAQLIYDCKIPVHANLSIRSGGVMVDIVEKEIVANVLAKSPIVLQRQIIEPGGRFRVDETGIKYVKGAGRGY